MNQITIDPKDQKCIFGLFDIEGNLIGYRQDTFGTLGDDWGKPYPYNPDQVEIVMKNITDMASGSSVKALRQIGDYAGDRSLTAKMVNHAKNNLRKVNHLKEFEVRVLPLADRDVIQDKDSREMWLMQAPGMEPLETYKISVNVKDKEMDSQKERENKEV